MGEFQRNQFTFYASFYDAIKRIRRPLDRERAYDAICGYALRGEEPDLATMPDAAAIAFINARPNLESGRKKALGGANGKPRSGGKKSERCDKDQGRTGERKGKDVEKEKEGEKEIEIENECYPPTPLPERSDSFRALWDSYPAERRGRRDLAYEAYGAVIRTKADVTKAMDHLRLWKESDQWRKEGGRYIPMLVNWLYRGAWDAVPAKTALPTGASGELGQAELEAIEQMFSRPTEPLPEDAYGDTL